MSRPPWIPPGMQVGDFLLRPVAACPHCGSPLNVDEYAGDVGEGGELGAIGLCVVCARPHVLERDGARRKPTELELQELESDPGYLELRAYVEVVGSVDRAWPRGRP